MVHAELGIAGSDRSRPNDHRRRVHSTCSAGWILRFEQPHCCRPGWQPVVQISNGSTNAIARMTPPELSAAVRGQLVRRACSQHDGGTRRGNLDDRIHHPYRTDHHIRQLSFHSVGGFNPFGIVAGSDGNLWFTAVATSGGSYIGQLTLNGLVETEAISGILDQSSVNPITSGPDGSLWFMIDPGSGPGSVGRITTAGSFGSVNIPPSNSYSFRAASIAPS